MRIVELEKQANSWLAEFGSEYAGRVKVSRRVHKDNLAEVAWNVEESRAWIGIRRGQGLESLYHECLHLILEGHRTHDGAYSELYERALNRIAAREIRLRPCD